MQNKASEVMAKLAETGLGEDEGEGFSTSSTEFRKTMIVTVIDEAFSHDATADVRMIARTSNVVAPTIHKQMQDHV